jgi:hypothetical protein
MHISVSNEMEKRMEDSSSILPRHRRDPVLSTKPSVETVMNEVVGLAQKKRGRPSKNDLPTLVTFYSDWFNQKPIIFKQKFSITDAVDLS